jgi:diguanylate cyclase (GGDEF)-like protein
MKLRNKILLAISLVWLSFMIIAYGISRNVILKSYLNLEQEHANRNLARVDDALDQISYSLYTFTADWSHWDDLYLYVQGKNPDFVANNLKLPAYLNSSINLLTYWDTKGNLLVGTAIDTEKKKLTEYPQDLDQYIYPGSLLLKNKQETRGLIALNNKIMLIASSSITDGNKHKRPLGTTVAGRYLSNELIKKISQITKVDVELYTLNEITLSPRLSRAYDKISQAQQNHYIDLTTKRNLESYSLLRDINGKPIAMLRISSFRAIYLAGLETIQDYLAGFTIVCIIFSLIMLWLLHHLMLRRLENLDKEIAHINTKQATQLRVTAEGNDELASVATEINSLMDMVQDSQNKLEERIQQRTIELQTTNTKLEQEISDRKSVEKELVVKKEHLLRLAHYDSLTGLPNRVFFNEILNKALNHSTRQHKMLAVLFIDLDRFKNINDEYGHPIGDQVLREIAVRFSSAIRAGDILSRLGGDEFIILLNDIAHPKFASPVAEKLLQACARPIIIAAHEFFLSASIGICVFPNDGTALEDLQRNADIAMYKAKRSGGGIFQYFTKDMDVQAHEHIQLEAALRKAIKENLFTLCYQPKINLLDGTITGVEALIRWEDPILGSISPAKFIPLAEETGLIMQIGEWALREACLANKRWQQQSYQPITVAVNLSPKQFRHQDISQLVASILQETGLAPEYLELEITETAVMDNVENAISKLNDIKKMGVAISLDDFGTGYTSISYLKQFPISIIKIDQSFVKGIPHNQNDKAITSAVIAMAHNLGLKVVAEGVETTEQLEYLAEHYCDMVQGYFLSRPLSEAKITTQLVKLEAEIENSEM